MKNKILVKKRAGRFNWLAVMLFVFAAVNMAAAQDESFNYAAGTPINGLNGGTGWNAGWIGGNGAVTGGGLNFPGITVSGNAMGPMGAFTKRFFASPVKACSMRIAVLIKSPSAGTQASQATIGNVDGVPDGTFIFGDLPQLDTNAGNWGIQNDAGRFYTNKPVVAGATVYLVAQIDFNSNIALNDTLSLWVNPSSAINLQTGTFPAPDVTTTTSNIKQFAGIFWQTQQQQELDEIRVARIPCAGQPQDGCCDTMKVTPYPNPPLNQDYRTFEIFNPLPGSPICSVDINMTPLPHTTNWQGGQAFQNLGFGYPSAPVNFTFASVPSAYRRIPTTTSFANMNARSNPLNSPAVVFNLGFDNTQAYNGSTTLTVNHCDGRKCVLEYKPWIVNPLTGTFSDNIPWRVNIRELSGELLELTLTFEGRGGGGPLRESRGTSRWLGVNLTGEGTEIYSIDGPQAVDEKRDSKKLNLLSSTKTATGALFEFGGLLSVDDREQAGKSITLLVRRREGMRIDPRQVRLTLYDENANRLSSGISR
jgi:hypothetical protein